MTPMKSTDGSVAEKWNWKMNYCKKERIPPAQTWAWNKAEKAYVSEHQDYTGLILSKE